MNVTEFLKICKEQVDHYLDEYLPPETLKPEIIHKAIRYSVFSGGKRFRAALCIAASDGFGGEQGRVLPVAAGIELIHAYSLIHDDLPCMDDDDLRRGKPTLHKVYGENIAVLAGDALNALSFDLVARPGDSRLIHVLAGAIGTKGMIGGQVADVMMSGKSGITGDDVHFIHMRKTAALIEASVRMGAISAGAKGEDIESIGAYGSGIGLAFQIVDDILDIVSSDDILGKHVGSDKDQDKATYPKVFGLEESKRLAREEIDRALGFLDCVDGDTAMLKELAGFVIERVY